MENFLAEAGTTFIQTRLQSKIANLVAIEAAQRESRVLYLMNDVHYYLSGWTPAVSGLCYISGGLFPSLPAENYSLPFGEGFFDITPKKMSKSRGMTPQMIRMRTKGSGIDYHHPNVRLGNVDQLWDYGYYMHFRTVLNSDDLNIYTLHMPVSCYTVGNPQRDFYDKVCSDRKVPHPFLSKESFLIENTSQWFGARIMNKFKKHKHEILFKKIIEGSEVYEESKGLLRKVFSKPMDFVFGKHQPIFEAKKAALSYSQQDQDLIR